MVSFRAQIRKFGQQGEKTGWTHICIPAATAQRIAPGMKKSFRVKGMVDTLEVQGVSLLPMGNGDFIMALNASMRRAIRRPVGVVIRVALQADDAPPMLSPELMECLADEPAALEFFQSLTPGHRKYFSNYVEGARTAPTKARRIAACILALERSMDFGAMLRSLRQKHD